MIEPIFHDVAQRSPEWHALRRGRPTASEFRSIFTSQGKPASSTVQSTYLHRLIAERLVDELPEPFESDWMRRGRELEPEAIRAYELARDLEVTPVGFVEVPGLGGCSPDGLVGTDGGVELKVPAPHTHVATLLAGKVPPDYVPQVQGAMLLTGRAWWDFVSYSPDLPPVIVRVERDEDYIAGLREALEKFNAKLEAALAKLAELGAVAA